MSEYENYSSSLEKVKIDYSVNKKKLNDSLNKIKEKMISCESFLLSNKDLTLSLIQLPNIFKSLTDYEKLIFSYAKERDHKKLELVYNMILVYLKIK